MAGRRFFRILVTLPPAYTPLPAQWADSHLIPPGLFFCHVPANGRKGSEYGVGKTILLLQDISSICLKLQLLGRRTVTTNGG
jgi:hypothetical protein